MMKIIKESIILFIVISVITAEVPYFCETAMAMAPGIEKNEVRLELDSENKMELPKHFRKAWDEVETEDDEEVNLAGLSTLNISGSHQFPEHGLFLVKESIGYIPVTVVDLRQESHGFINGTAVSWSNEKNNANQGLTKEQVLMDEDRRLRAVPLNHPLTLYNHDHETIIPGKVENEKKLVESQGMSYVRIPVTDGRMPADDMVDYFVEFVKSQPKGTWIHFHCRAGAGRTTTFMIMYDMMKNAKQVSPEDIIRRQVLLADLSPHSTESFYSEERMGFLNRFYKYVKENTDNFYTSWSQWNKSQQ